MDCDFEGTNCKFCNIDCEEKAPEGTAIPTGANETNQSKSNADFGNCQESAIPKIKELVGLLGRMEELREELDILSVRGDYHSVEVHVSSDSFPDLFSFGEYDTKRFAEYGSDEYRAVVGGVKFFCLVDKEVQDDVYLHEM